MKHECAVEMGRRGGRIGGRARAESLSPSERSAAARKAAKARWHKPIPGGFEERALSNRISSLLWESDWIMRHTDDDHIFDEQMDLHLELMAQAERKLGWSGLKERLK